MDSNHLQHTSSRDKACVDKKHEDGKLQYLKQPHHEQQGKESQPPVSVSPASPPSASSSPSHEFSFTISLHHHSSSTTTTIPADKAANKPPPSFAIDLSPADDIFFHGHLLPLHLLSHLPVSPRSSTNSMDSFSLPIKDLLDDQTPSNKETNNCSSSSTNHNISNKKISSSSQSQSQSQRQSQSQSQSGNSSDQETMRGRNNKSSKSSFSLFGFTRWRKGCEDQVREDKEDKQKRKVLRFEVVKRYMRMVQPLSFFRGRRDNMQLRTQPYSFSGNLAFRRNKPDLRGRRGEFSAPASMRTSPSNSGLLVATATLPSSTTDSTMEELQAAIQAAIAHCKNSIASDDKLKC